MQSLVQKCSKNSIRQSLERVRNCLNTLKFSFRSGLILASFFADDYDLYYNALTKQGARTRVIEDTTPLIIAARMG